MKKKEKDIRQLIQSTAQSPRHASSMLNFSCFDLNLKFQDKYVCGGSSHTTVNFQGKLMTPQEQRIQFGSI